ncbi:ABC transporter substrate-binding protein [Candidatus Spongiihabitans sp.]|uniref:ABC transporter substrate-binding protein n=1 Tax=Candidatus Spongiihabitans sp. TaxID=3101308 RepID=UPI003C6EB8BF
MVTCLSTLHPTIDIFPASRVNKALCTAVRNNRSSGVSKSLRHPLTNNFMGTGPYILEEFKPGVSFKASRNPNYWKNDRAWVDSVEMFILPTQQPALARCLAVVWIL